MKPWTQYYRSFENEDLGGIYTACLAVQGNRGEVEVVLEGSQRWEWVASVTGKNHTQVKAAASRAIKKVIPSAYWMTDWDRD